MKLSEYTIQDDLETELISFIRQYGLTGLKEAMQLYAEASQDYICKTKTSVYKIKIKDIYYLKIRGHHITVHTENGIYRKYGTLHQEFSLLSPYGFLKCSQSCIVAPSKISRIEHDTIILCNHDRLHISRTCTAKILTSFHRSSAALLPEKP